MTLRRLNRSHVLSLYRSQDLQLAARLDPFPPRKETLDVVLDANPTFRAESLHPRMETMT